MKKNMLFFLIPAGIISLFTSCDTPRYAYSPSAHNVPVLEKKGDSKIGASYSTNFSGEQKYNSELYDNRSRGYDIHGAVAITDHFAVQGGYFHRWEKTTGGVDSFTIRYKRNLTEFGLGYFLPVTPSKNLFFQFFGGVGFGKFSFTDNSKTGAYFHEANIVKVYLQPALQIRSKGSFTTSIALRGSIVNFSKIHTNYTSSQLDDYHLDSLGNRSKFFFEPGFVSSFGFKGLPGLRIEFQGGLSFLASRHILDYRIVNFSVGTYVNIGELFFNNKQ